MNKEDKIHTHKVKDIRRLHLMNNNSYIYLDPILSQTHRMHRNDVTIKNSI